MTINNIFFGLFIFFCILPINFANAKKFKLTSTSYTKKSPYAGFGKKSAITGRIKTKSVRGYFKPSNGYKFVNSYAKSR